MEAGKHFLIESCASANSVYFETDKMAKLFFRYYNYYLKDYLQVEEYVLNQSGWAMLIKVKSSKTIRKYYNSEGQQSKKDKYPKAIWQILSERVRLFISTYVRMSNKILGRKGSLVGQKYGRYKFESIEEARTYISTIRNDRHELHQVKEKYRGMKEHFRMSGTIQTNPLRNSKWLDKLKTRERIREEVGKIFGVDSLVLQGIGQLVRLNKNDINSWNKKPPPYTKKT